MANDLFKLENAKKAYERASQSADRRWDIYHSFQADNAVDTEKSNKYFQSGEFIGSMLYLIAKQKDYIEALEDSAEQHNSDVREIVDVLYGYVRPGVSILTGIKDLIRRAYPDSDV